MFSQPKKNLEELDLFPGLTVADFGSGAGYYTFLAAHAVGASGHVYALDAHKEILVTLKREADKSNLFNVEVLQVDLEADRGTKLRDGLIDRAIITNVLFQIGNKKGFIKEVARVMKTECKILVVDWLDSFGGMGPAKSDVFGKDECRKIFEQGGFVLEKEFDAGAHHYGFVFKRV